MDSTLSTTLQKPMSSPEHPSSQRFLLVVCVATLFLTAIPTLPQQPDTKDRGGSSLWTTQTPTPGQLHSYLEASYRRSLLIGGNAAPFHLVARIDLLNERQHIGSGMIEELWRDPLHWKLTVSYDGSTFTEVDNGSSAYTLGAMPAVSLCCYSPNLKEANANLFSDLFHAIEEALFSPFRPELLTTRRLTLHKPLTTAHSLQMKYPYSYSNCIGAQPELPGVPPNIPIAETTYCLDSHDLTLIGQHDDSSGGNVDRYDVAPFGDKLIARTIEFNESLGKTVRVRIVTLESASDFSALNAPVPPDAHRGKAHSQEDLTVDDLIRGKTGSTVEIPLLCKQPNYSPVQLKLHIDAGGSVTGFDVLSDLNHIMTVPVIEAARQIAQQWRFPISYRNARPIPLDQIVWSGSCVV
jgi:hypothetical protein